MRQKNSVRRVGVRAALIAAALLVPASFVDAAALTNGNLVVYRVGTGSAALSGSATAVFLDEYTTTGTLVQSIIVPATGTGAITAIGSSVSEGILSLSSNGQLVSFTGYRRDVGTAPASGDQRVIGSLDLAGNVTTAATVAGSVGTPRSATTKDGSSYYLGSSVSVYHIAAPGTLATTTVIDARNSRQVALVGDNLLASNGSTTITGKVQSYGNLPTTLTPATPLVSLLSSDAVNGFTALDLDGTPGVDTIYAVIQTGTARLGKFSLVSGVWTATGSVSVSANNVTAYPTATGVSLFITTNSSIFAVNDNSGFGGTLTGTVGTAIAAAGTNRAFRGIAVVPEPAALGLLGLALPLVSRRRR